MTKATIYTRSSTGDHDRQRDELVAKLGDTHEIVGEYRDDASGNQGVGDRPGLKKLLEDAAQGKFDVLLCADLSRLTRQVTPEIIMTLKMAGVRIMTAEGGEVGITDLFAQAIMNQLAKTESQRRSERIKQGIWAARERRAAADTAEAGSGNE